MTSSYDKTMLIPFHLLTMRHRAQLLLHSSQKRKHISNVTQPRSAPCKDGHNLSQTYTVCAR